MAKLIKGLTLLLLIVLTACSAGSPAVSTSVPTASAPAPVGQAAESYPAGGLPAVNSPTEAYPGPPQPTDDPMAPYPQSLQVPSPAAGKGVITGRVLGISNNEVYLAPSLYLGKLTFASDPNAAPPLVSFSEKTSPQGVQDRAGKFVFSEVEPGTYAVVVWTPGSSTLLSDQEGNTAVIEVAADQTADMGDVYVP